MPNTITYGGVDPQGKPAEMPPYQGIQSGDWNSLTDNPISHFIFGDPGKGYETAAQGAMGASRGYGDLANWQWGMAQQGLGQAQGAYNPSNLLWNQYYGNGPGTSQSQDVMGQFRNYMQQPTNAGSAYQNAQSALGGYQTSTADYNQRFGNQMSGRYSQAELGYNPSNYSSPGAAESFYGQAQNTLGGPGRAEQLNYQDTNNMQNFAAGLAGQQGIGATTAGQGEIGGYYRGANDVSQYANSQLGQLQGPGAYEQFVQSDINGTNPQIQRETDQGLARINQEMARRGGFKSGGASTAIGNFLGEEGAKDYQNRAERAQSAQGMQLSRIGAGQSLTGASAQGKLAQGSALQGLAGQTDAEKMSRLGQQLTAQQGASGESLANAQGRLQYAQAGDQGALARTQALGGIAGQAQNAELARLAGGMTAAGQSDQGFMNRMMAGYQMGQGADQAALARAQGLYGMAQGADQGTMAQYGMLGGLAGQTDQNYLARMGQMFGTRMGLDQANAGSIANFYGMGMGGYGQYQGDSLNALANYYQLMGQGQGADAAMPFQIANGVAQFMPGRGGGGGGGR